MTNENHLIAKEGLVIISVFILLTIGAFFLHPLAGVIGVALSIFNIYFFRNPKRHTPQNDGFLICPADGRVIFVGESEEHFFLKKKMKRITVFMSPFNVHVNRAPASGKVLNQVHFSGKFLAAFDERASLENERSAILLELENKDQIVFVQIAGWFARRIISYPKIGDILQKGKIFGLIKFGSRMDIYVPENYEPLVAMGQTTMAGETLLAKVTS